MHDLLEDKTATPNHGASVSRGVSTANDAVWKAGRAAVPPRFVGDEATATHSHFKIRLMEAVPGRAPLKSGNLIGTTAVVDIDGGECKGNNPPFDYGFKTYADSTHGDVVSVERVERRVLGLMSDRVQPSFRAASQECSGDVNRASTGLGMWRMHAGGAALVALMFGVATITMVVSGTCG